MRGSCNFYFSAVLFPLCIFSKGAEGALMIRFPRFALTAAAESQRPPCHQTLYGRECGCCSCSVTKYLPGMCVGANCVARSARTSNPREVNYRGIFLIELSVWFKTDNPCIYEARALTFFCKLCAISQSLLMDRLFLPYERRCRFKGKNGRVGWFNECFTSK